MVRDELHAVGLDVVHRVDGEVRQGEFVLLGELARGAVDVLALDVDHDDVDLLPELLVLLLPVPAGLVTGRCCAGLRRCYMLSAAAPHPGHQEV